MQKFIDGSQKGSVQQAKILLLALLFVLTGFLMVLASPLGPKYLGIKLSSLFSSASTPSLSDSQAKYVNNVATYGSGAYFQVSNNKLVPVSHPGLDVLSCLNVPRANINTATPEQSSMQVDSTKTIFCNPVSASPHPHGTVIAGLPGGASSTAYYIEYGSVRVIPSSQVFECNKFDYAKIVLANTSDVKLPMGEAMDCNPLKFVNNVNGPDAIYKVESNVLVPVSHPGREVLVCLGIDPSKIESAPPTKQPLIIADNRPIFCNPPSTTRHPDGTLISGLPTGVASSAYLIENGKIRTFPSSEVFECNKFDYSKIVLANTADVKLPFGDPMYCEGKHYVTNVNGPQAYYKVENGKLLPVSHPGRDVLACLGISMGYVVEATSAEKNLPVDNTKTIFCNPESTTRHPDGTLISGLPTGVASSAYLIENGKIRTIPSNQVFECNKFDYSKIVLANTADVKLPFGEGISCPGSNPTPTPTRGGGGSNPTPTPTPVPTGISAAGTLIKSQDSNDRTVWLVSENKQRRPFLSADIFYSHGYRWSNIKTATSDDMKLPLGNPMTFAYGSLVLAPTYNNVGNTVYLISPQGKRGFTSYQVFKDMGYKDSMIFYSSIGMLDNGYGNGPVISSVEAHSAGTDIVHNGTVFYVDHSGRLAYPGITVFNSWHSVDNDFTRVVPANTYDLVKSVIGTVRTR